MVCLEGDLCLVHAAIHPAWRDLPARAAAFPVQPASDPTDPDVRFAITARCCTRSGAPARYTGPAGGCPDGTRPWDDFYRGGHTVIHGHWAARGHYRNGNVLGLDSGCAYGGGLTAWCAEEDRIEWVPSRRRD
jgi:bis(5'-nucleosyl)-tetraphosphatase (symmetrical)